MGAGQAVRVLFDVFPGRLPGMFWRKILALPLRLILAAALGLLSVLGLASGALAALVSRLTGSFPVDFKLDISAPPSDS